MKISRETLENFTLAYPLERIVPLEQALFLDIETTGFTAKTSCLYLMGCAYYEDGRWRTIQWLAEDSSQEASILAAFFQFALPYRFLIHFNGNNFDLPFLMKKCELLALPYHFDYFEGIDLYQRISPYKFFLNLPNGKQKTMEQFLGFSRQDVFSGSELIGIYQEYVKNPSEFSEKSLFLHNADDIRGMLEILPALSYYDLFHTEVRAKKVQANTYRDYAGKDRRELFMYLSLPAALPKPVSAVSNHCYFRGEEREGVLKVPIYEEELKYFYANYQDYYYLPEEDTALHKSVAAYVDPAHRVQAAAATCYTRKYSAYLPQWEHLFAPFFKKDYKGKELFFELTEERKKDRAAFSAYANHVLRMIASMF
ncbi:MAG: ribonuclease H-like domain-containing protein [Clostridium sp.]|jgi:uncharacterized protein YprB with RNaseH-like and TPR domain|nr:ribonuclease H-like domain-containing protein [Clostridium sp.]